MVVTRGDTEYVERTLEAVRAQTRRPDRLVVVDVGPDPAPGVRALVRGLHPPGGRGAPGGADDAVGNRTVDRTDAPADPAADDAAPVVVHVHLPRAATFGDAVRGALVAGRHVGRDDDAGPDDAGPGRAAQPARPGTTDALAPPAAWLWLLHDDSAPEADALAELLHAVELAPSVAVAGCKQRTWSEPPRVLEVGVWTSRFGRRMTGLDGPELDQGQHDAREDVLAVGLAGALVREDVWDALGGPDPALGPYGDGLDLCRRARLAGHRVVAVPRAVVRHAQASLSEPHSGAVLHRPGWDRRRSVRARRAAYLHAQLSGVPLPLVPVVTVLAVVSGLVRALGRLLVKEPHLVTAELSAPWQVLLRPARVVRARRAAARTRRLPRRSLRPLQVGWREVVRQARDRRLTAAEARRRQEAPSELELRELAALRRRRRGGLAAVTLLAVALTVATVGRLVTRVVAGERLAGGAVLPGDAGAAEVWRLVLSGRVPAGLGEAAPVDPALVALLPLTALTGSLGRAVAVVVLLAPVLAALGAWFAAGAATRSVALRAWAALTWALAPAMTLGVGTGRWGAVLAHVLLPWVVLGVARGTGAARVDSVSREVDRGTPGPASRRAPASLAALAGGSLALAAATAGAPVLLPAALVAVVLLLPVVPVRGRLLWLPVPALALHGPTLVDAVGRWSDGGWRTVLADPGEPLRSTTAPAWQVLLGWPVAPGGAPDATGVDVAAAPSALDDLLGPWLPVALLAASGVLVLVALVALATAGRTPAAVAARIGWVLVAVGVLAAAVGARVEVARADGVLVAPWPGGATSLVAVGLLVAALPAADGLREALARHAFGWRQGTAGVLTVVAVAGPAVLATAWVWSALDGAGGQGRSVLALRTSDVPVVPAAGRQLQNSPEDVRVLLLEPTAGDAVDAALLRGDGRQLTEVSRSVTARAVTGGWGAARPAAPDEPAERTSAAVARLVAGGDDDVAADLAALGVGAVLLPAVPGDEGLLPAGPGGAVGGGTETPVGATGGEPGAADTRSARAALVAQLDATPGLERVTETASGVIWRVAVADGGTTTAWARAVGAGGDAPVVVPARDGTVRTEVAPGTGDRVLVLAERPDPGWRATLDGRPLRAVRSAGLQAFELGPDAGLLVVEHVAASRPLWVGIQGVVLVVTLLLAVPVRRRRGGAR
nr:glycosyltransferase [uncultured Actinotalea sp.]